MIPTTLKRRLLCDFLDHHTGDWEDHGEWAYLHCDRCERLVHPVSPRTPRRIGRT